jgi:hypothetical protein
MSVTTPIPLVQKSISVSTLPYALFVPILVIMAQSAWAVRYWDFRHHALLAGVDNPVVLCGMVVVAVISFFVIRPFVRRPASRWIAFLSCVVGFTMVIEPLMPKIVV